MGKRTRLESILPHRVILLASLFLGLLLAPGLSAQAAFTVNTMDDVDDGTCDVAHCSLR